jgi:DNA polymerase-3 subunit beta
MEFTIKQSVLKEELATSGVVELRARPRAFEYFDRKPWRKLDPHRRNGPRCDDPVRRQALIKPAMCIQARKLFDIVRTLDEGDVHFKKEDNEWVQLKAGRAKFRLAGVNREQYPEIPIFKSAPMKLSAEVFNYFIQNTSFAITNETSRFTLSGAKFVIDGDKARMVTTDGHRLAFIESRSKNRTRKWIR